VIRSLIRDLKIMQNHVDETRRDRTPPQWVSPLAVLADY
jgi:hypothetical protein